MSKNFWFILSVLSIVLFFILSFFVYSYLVIPDTQDLKVLNVEDNNLNYSKPIEVDDFIEKNGICKNCVRRLIDGVYVKEGDENFYPIATIIDNHINARPQFGLSKANLVYEVEVEGGITRYLAIFANSEDIEKIGPIRSLRPYFIDLSREFSPLLAHVGGSPAALVQIVRDNIFNINQFYKGKYFWRDNEKKVPHNVYTSYSNLNAYLDSLNIKKGEFLEWKFKDDNNSDTVYQVIEVPYDKYRYIVEWRYDKENNDYIRYLDNGIHYDGKQEIRAKNVIIQYATSHAIDEKLRLDINVVGSGKASICFDGVCEVGGWIKKTATSRTRFYDNKFQEIAFNAGKIWINVVDE